jgi:hypothetical protein
MIPDEDLTLVDVHIGSGGSDSWNPTVVLKDGGWKINIGTQVDYFISQEAVYDAEIGSCCSIIHAGLCSGNTILGSTNIGGLIFTGNCTNSTFFGGNNGLYSGDISGCQIFAQYGGDPTTTEITGDHTGELIGYPVEPLLSTATNLTLTSAHHTVLVTADATITLPAAASHSGRVYVIKKTYLAGTGVIIDGNAAETIDCAATVTLTVQYSSRTIQSDGTNWQIIGSYL